MAWNQILLGASEDEVDLVSRLVQYESQARMRANDASYLHTEKSELANHEPGLEASLFSILKTDWTSCEAFIPRLKRISFILLSHDNKSIVNLFLVLCVQIFQEYILVLLSSFIP